MKQLTIEQRYQIQAYLKVNMPKSHIAKTIGVARATIYRELSRNKQKRGGYTAKTAQEYADIRKERFVAYRTFDVNCKRMATS